MSRPRIHTQQPVGNSSRSQLITAVVTLMLSVSTAVAQAAVIQATPSNYRSLIGGLGPGDTLVLASGIYSNGLTISGKHGAPGNPIVITGPESGEPAVITGRACCNTIQIENSSHIEVRHLKVDALGIDGIDGVNGRGTTHHITIAHVHFVRHDYDQQTNAISTKGPAWNWIIRDNIIDGAGTGIYLGDSNGGQPFVNGIIERNLIVNTIGYNMQIKHQNPRPTGIGMPTGNSRTIIRHNVFGKSGNSSTGGNARPNLLVGHFPLSGAGMNDIYEIYGNFFYQNPTEALFQGEGNIAMYANLMVNDFGSAIHVQPHNDVPRRVMIFRNTIVAAGNGIRISGGAAGFERRVIGNAVFAGTPISAPDNTANITGSRAAAANFLVNPFASPGALNLFPMDGALGGAGFDIAPLQDFTDSGVDFDGRTHPAGQRGAYAAGSGPLWPLALAIKGSGAAGQPPASPQPPPDDDEQGGSSPPATEYKPLLLPPGSQPVGEALIGGPAFTDVNGGSLAAARWQVFELGTNRQVYGRRIPSRVDLHLPIGVLEAGKDYRVRVRHEDVRQQLSAWSDFQTFSAGSWNDADNNGTHDFYQDGPQTADDRCRLRDPASGAVELMTLTSSSRIRCVSMAGAEGIASTAGVMLEGESAPWGFMSFRIDGLPVNSSTPAAVSVMLYLPNELRNGGRWYEYDRATGVVTDASRRATGLAAGTRQVMISLVDGGNGDLDGVVNGSVVVEGGLLTTGLTGQIGGSGSGSGGVQTSADAGGEVGVGAAGLIEALAMAFAVCWLCASAAARNG